MNLPDHLKNKSILVVDDQSFIRGMVAQSIKRVGFASVAEASDGFEAVQMLGGGDGSGEFKGPLAHRPDITDDLRQKKKMIDCVITDIRMSPMNGLELLKAIRCGVAGPRRDLPVVIMSAHSDDELISAAIALDANAFIVKPASQSTLIEKVVRALTIERQVQNKGVYAALFVPEVDEQYTQFDGSKASQTVQAIRAMDVAALRRQSAINVPIGQLVADDILLEGVVALTGTVIVPIGTRVTPALIHALGDLTALIELPDAVNVKRRTM